MSRPDLSSPVPARSCADPLADSGAAEEPGRGRSSVTVGAVMSGRAEGGVWPWRAGDEVAVWMGGMVRHRGIVEESAAHLGVVWIREWGIGARIMVDVAEAELRPLPRP